MPGKYELVLRVAGEESCAARSRSCPGPGRPAWRIDASDGGHGWLARPWDRRGSLLFCQKFCIFRRARPLSILWPAPRLPHGGPSGNGERDLAAVFHLSHPVGCPVRAMVRPAKTPPAGDLACLSRGRRRHLPRGSAHHHRDQAGPSRHLRARQSLPGRQRRRVHGRSSPRRTRPIANSWARPPEWSKSRAPSASATSPST